MVAPAVIGAVVGGIAQMAGAHSAGASQEKMGKKDLKFNKKVWRQTRQDFRDYRRFGNKGMDAYRYEMGLGRKPQGYRGFEETPGYKWELEQGQNAIDNSAASRGGLFSSATLDRQMEFGQGLARRDYGNHVNRLGGMVDAGMNATGAVANAGSRAATGVSNALGAIGNAQAASAVGMGNALSDGLQNWMTIDAYQKRTNAMNA